MSQEDSIRAVNRVWRAHNEAASGPAADAQRTGIMETFTFKSPADLRTDLVEAAVLPSMLVVPLSLIRFASGGWLLPVRKDASVEERG